MMKTHKDKPVYTWWDEVPPGLMTKTALAQHGFKPGSVVAHIEYGKGKRHRLYDLYDLAEAKPITASSKQHAAREKAALSRRTCKACTTVLDDPKHRHTGLCWTCLVDTGEQAKGKTLAEADTWMRALLRRYQHSSMVAPAIITISDALRQAMQDRVGLPHARVYDLASSTEQRTYSGCWLCPTCHLDSFPVFPWCMHCGYPRRTPPVTLPLTDRAFSDGGTPLLDAIRISLGALGAAAALAADEDVRHHHASSVRKGVRVERIRLSPWLAARLADELATAREYRSFRDWESLFGCKVVCAEVDGEHPAALTFFAPTYLSATPVVWRFR